VTRCSERHWRLANRPSPNPITGRLSRHLRSKTSDPLAVPALAGAAVRVGRTLVDLEQLIRSRPLSANMEPLACSTQRGRSPFFGPQRESELSLFLAAGLPTAKHHRRADSQRQAQARDDGSHHGVLENQWSPDSHPKKTQQHG